MSSIVGKDNGRTNRQRRGGLFACSTDELSSDISDMSSQSQANGGLDYGNLDSMTTLKGSSTDTTGAAGAHLIMAAGGTNLMLLTVERAAAQRRAVKILRQRMAALGQQVKARDLTIDDLHAQVGHLSCRSNLA